MYSGGKDSNLATLFAKNLGYEISCLISIISKNPDSFMFHTPSISKVESQAKAMQVPLILKETKGEKEIELNDLKEAIKIAIKKYNIKGIVTGTVESVYQSSRIQKICNELDIECFNPLWQKNQLSILKDLIKYKFESCIVGVAAFPLDKKFLGRKIDNDFIKEMEDLQMNYKINIAGEGGEYESFVLNCPLFKKRLEIKKFVDFFDGENSCRREIELK